MADTAGTAESEVWGAYAGLMSDLSELGYEPGDFISQVPITPYTAQMPIEFDRRAIWEVIAREQSRGRFANLPGTRDEFERGASERVGARAEQASAVAARGNPVAAFIGGMGGSMTDPTTALTSVIPFGFGKTLAQQILAQGIIGAAVEGGLQPGIAVERDRQGRELTLGEAGMNMAFAGAAGATIRGGIELAPPVARGVSRVIDANVDRLPGELGQRWTQRNLEREMDLLQDPTFLADVSEALLGRESLSREAVEAVDGLRSVAQFERSNPFARNGAGQSLHDALMQQVAADALARAPFPDPATVPVRSPGLPQPPQVASAVPAPRLRVPEGPGANPQEGFMARVRQRESGGDDDARNPRSSATGRYQFIDSTWIAYFTRRYGRSGLSDAQILARRSDSAVQDQLMRDLTADNAGSLRRGGEAVTEGNLYLAHFAGPRGALDVLRAPEGALIETVLGRAVIDANPFLRGKTVDWLVEWAARNMGGAGAPRRGGARAQLDQGRADSGIGNAIAQTEAEAATIQDALDSAVARADAAERDQRVARGQEQPLPDVLAEAAGWEPVVVDFDGRLADMGRDMPAPPARLLPELQAIVATPRRSLNNIDALARDLDADPLVVRQALTQLALNGEIGMKVPPNARGRVGGRGSRSRAMTDAEMVAARGGVWDGQFTRIYARNEREHLLQFVARQGGISFDGLDPRFRAAEEAASGGKKIPGHDLKNSGGLDMYVFGAGRLLKRDGMGLDQMGELLAEAGYFPERPTDGELIEVLSRLTGTGEKRFADGNVSTAGDRRAAQVGAGGSRTDPDAHDLFNIFYEVLSDSRARIGDEQSDRAAVMLQMDEAEMAEVVAMMRQGLPGLPPIEPLYVRQWEDIEPYLISHINMKIDEALDEARYEVDDDAYEFPWFDDPATETGGAGGGGDGRAFDAGNAGEGEAGPRAGGDRAPNGAGYASGDELARLPEAERTAHIDPDGPAIKAQADSLMHDARAVLDSRLQPVLRTTELPRDGVIPGRPGVMVGKGDIVQTATGRETTPVPNVSADTNRKAINASARMDQWLIENARAEAQARGDDFNGPMFDRMEPRKLSPSDIDILNEYLFGDEQPPILRSIFGPLSDQSLADDLAGQRGPTTTTTAADGQMDFAAPSQEQARIALERQGEGRLAGQVAQRDPGSDGGLFDVRATDLEFRLDDGDNAPSLRSIIDDIDAEEADLKAIRDCL